MVCLFVVGIALYIWWRYSSGVAWPPSWGWKQAEKKKHAGHHYYNSGRSKRARTLHRYPQYNPSIETISYSEYWEHCSTACRKKLRVPAVWAVLTAERLRVPWQYIYEQHRISETSSIRGTTMHLKYSKYSRAWTAIHRVCQPFPRIRGKLTNHINI